MKNFKLILKSLFSNGATVEGARHRPWYFAVITLILSMAIALTPIFVTAIGQYGKNIVKNTDSGLKDSSMRFSQSLNEKGVELEVKYNEAEKTNILTDNGTWNVAFEDTYEYNNIQFHFYQHRNAENMMDLTVYYLGAMNTTEMANFYNALKTSFAEANQPLPNLYLFAQKEVCIYARNVQTNQDVQGLLGDYKNLKIGYNFKDTLSKIEITDPATQRKAVNETWENWKVFYDRAYDNNRIRNAWMNTLLMLAINAALVFFMGLMVFVLTRGKNNPFRIYTFWESQKVSFWAANMPALLTCGFGFLFTNFSQVLFALLLGIRVMWLTMKTLGPNNTPTPVQQKQIRTVNVKSAN